MGIHEAVGSGKRAAVERLLDEGADVDERAALKMTPLHAAAKKGAAGVAALLVERGADVNAKDYRGYTPLHHAAAEAHTKVVELLLGHGADPAARNTFKDTPLHKAAGGAGLHKPAARRAIAEQLIEAGCPVDAVNTPKQTALWHAAARGNLPLMRALLARGADPSIKAQGQQGTPLDAARENGQAAAVKLLEKLEG